MFELLVSCFRIDRFGDHEVSLFKKPESRTGPYASKKPTDFIHVRRVMKWDPHLFVLYMQRDGRDVIVSRHGSQLDHYWCDFGLWQRNQGLLEGFSSHPRLMVCRYEDLVSRPDDVQEEIAGRFPFLVKTGRFSDFEKVSQTSEAALMALRGMRCISPESVGAWRANLPRVKAQFERYPQMGHYLIKAGYEPDDRWLSLLDSVEADASVSMRQQHGLARNTTGLPRFLHRLRRRGTSLAQELRYIAGTF